MSHGLGRRSAPTLLAGAALIATAGPAAAGPATTLTSVEHDVVFEQRFDEDLCGRGSHVERFHHKVAMNHLTQKEDGSFTFVDFETGTITLDFDDPTVPDQVFRRTNTFTITFRPGGVVIVNETFRQAAMTATITYRYHLTEVAGVPTVEKEVTNFEFGCA